MCLRPILICRSIQTDQMAIRRLAASRFACLARPLACIDASAACTSTSGRLAGARATAAARTRAFASGAGGTGGSGGGSGGSGEDEWVEVLDEKTKQAYYWNPVTGETTNVGEPRPTGRFAREEDAAAAAAEASAASSQSQQQHPQQQHDQRTPDRTYTYALTAMGLGLGLGWATWYMP